LNDSDEQIHLLIDGGRNFDIYNENRIITQNNWVTLLKELSSKTAQSLKKKFPNINDLRDFLQEDLYQELFRL